MRLLLLYFCLGILMVIKASIEIESETSLNENFTFQVFTNKSSFWEAKRFCLKDNNYVLATVKSKVDSDKLIETLRKRNIESAWIGLTDFGRERHFYWTNDHSSSTFKKWGKGFPNDDRNASDCVLIKRNKEDTYEWIDMHCASKHAFVCMESNTTDSNKTVLLPPHSHYINQCPEPFSPVDGDCFWISRSMLTWSESRLLCQSKVPESDLASIRTDFQQEYFAALISGSATGYWIGLNFYDNAYQWILQHDLKIQRWGENQPKESSKKNCTFIGNNEHNLGNWYTSFCSERYNAICQTLKKNNETDYVNNNNTIDLTYDNLLFIKGNCERSGYYYYHGSCYRLHYDKQLNYNDAIKFCNNETFRNKSGYNFLVELISRPSAGEKNLILADLRKFVSNFQNSNVWLNIRGNGTDVKNFQNVPANQTFPLQRIKHLCFKLLTNGVVNSSDCDDNSKGIPMCKYQLKNFNKQSLKSNRLTATCPVKWTLFNSFCYFIDNQTYQSQYEAKKACLKLKSSLVSIDMNVEEFLADFLKKFMYSSKSPNVWIGLEARNISDEDQQFKWINENPVTYLNIESINVTGKHKTWCSIFVVKLGLWRLTNCLKLNAMAVCQQPANITSMQSSKKANSTKKINRYSKPMFVYKPEPLTWKNANNKCKSLPKENGLVSYLVTINSVNELNNITAKRKVNRRSYVWIGLSGLYDHYDNVFLRWADGSNVVFQNYYLQNLMNLTGTENCVMMDMKSGKWFGSDCNIKRPYMCRIESKRKTDFIKPDSKLDQLLENKHELQFCPEDFHEYSQKCYRVVDDEPLDWVSADKYCQRLVPTEYARKASLASIDSRFENSFVYSLLSSSMSASNDTNYWIGERYAPVSLPFCAGMSSHPDPYVGARWFTEDCKKKRKFICSSLKLPINKPISTGSSCLHDDIEYNNSLGTHCYHFDDHPNKIDEASRLCDLRKSSSLSLPSHYHLHFLLSQLEKVGWSRDNPIWLGLKIEQSQKLYHWQWDNGDDVRYTIWNGIQNLNAEGLLCMYLLSEKDNTGRFGMQIEECNKLNQRGHIICETTKNLGLTEKANPNKNCLVESRGDGYEGDMNTTVNGFSCIRWDLLKKPNRLIRTIRRDTNKHNYVQYHSNECRFIADMKHSTTFCATSSDITNDSGSFEECNIGLCSHKILHHEEESIHVEHHSNVMTAIIVTLLLLICVIACIALLSWRRWNKSSLFGGYLRRGQFSMLNSNQSRGTSFNNPIYSPINC